MSAPVVAVFIPDQSSSEDAAWSYQVPANTFFDADGDTLTYSATLGNGDPLPSWLTFNPANRTFTGTPPADVNGTFDLKVIAADGSSNASDSFTLTVAAVNDAPTVSGPVTASVSEGSSVTANPLANATDVDGPGLALVPTGTLPAGVSFTGASQMIDFQSYALGDVIGQQGWSDASPTSPANQIVDVGGNKKLLLANDPSSGDFGGPYSPAFAFKVGETGTGAQGDTLKVSFTIQAVNNVADGSRIEIDLGKEGRDDRYNFMAIEYTSQGLRLVQNSPKPDGLWQNDDFDFGTGNIQLGGYLNPSLSYTIDVVFRAVDGSNNDIVDYYVNGTLVGSGSTFENYQEFHLGQPHAPSAVNTVLFRAGEPAGNPFPADGPGGARQGFYIDNLGYSAYDSNGLTLDASNPAYDHLAAGQMQQVTVTYDVVDGQGGVTPASTVFTVTGTNDAPAVAAPLADQVTTEDSSWTYQVPAGAFTDVDDGTTLSYGATLADGSALPSWLLFDASTRTFSLAPGSNGNGTFDVKVTASDGSLSASDTFTLTVAPVNDVPTVSGPVTASVNEGGSVTVDPLANATDIDGLGLALVPTGALPAGVSFTGASQVIDFESYALGTVVGQQGWSDSSPTSPANEIVDVGGNKKLLLANDPTSGDFGGPYSPGFAFKVGETATGAQGDTLKVSFTIQAVSNVADGSRIEIDFGREGLDDRHSFMAIEYTSQGLRLVQNSPKTDGFWQNDDFDFGTGNIQLGGYLNPSLAYTIDMVFRAVDGSDNDIVDYYVNGTLVGSGSSFENFWDFHLGQPHAPPKVNTVLFRAGEPAGNPFPADGPGGARQGFYIDNLGYSAYDSNSLTLDASNPAYDHLAAGQTQQVTVTYDVVDGQGGVTPASTVFTVTGVNDAPVLSAPLADQVAAEDSSWTFQVPAGAFTDVDDGTTLTYSATLGDGSALPSWLLFDAGTRTFSLAPNSNMSGALDVKVTASDGSSSASDTFTLTVVPVNDAPNPGPVVLAPSNEDTIRTITAAELLALGDVDSSNLTISNLTASSGTLIDLGGGSWSFTPDLDDDTGVTFTYTVTDDYGVSQINHTPADQTSTLFGAADGSVQYTEARLGAITTVDGPGAGTDLALKLETDNNSGRLRFNNVFDSDSRFTLGSLSTLKFDYYIESASQNNQTPVIRIQIDGDGNLATTADRGELVFEWAYQNMGATMTGQWLTADLAGDNWVAWQRANGQNLDNVAIMTTLSDWQDANGYTPAGGVHFDQNSLVLGWSLATGSGNGTNTFYVDDVNVNGVNHDFEHASSTVTATLDLLPVNDQPVANDDFETATEGENPGGNVLGNDSDVDTGQTLAVIGISGSNGAGVVGQEYQGQYGKLTLQSDGTYNYTAENTTLQEGDVASETFTYTVSDGNGGTATADIIVTVTGGNPPFEGNQPNIRGSINPNFVSEGTGDFDGNGTIDFLWRNSSTDAVEIWTTSTAGAITKTGLGTVAANYHFETTGDLNGDGRDDVVIRDVNTGVTGAWIMRNGAPADWRAIGTLDANWEISGAGDFNGDGTDDLLLFNTATHAVDVWQQTASGIGARQTIATVAADWTVAGVGNLDGNSTDDVLLFNTTTRQTGAWQMSNGKAGGWYDYGTLAAGWEITEIGNFNGSGPEDIGFYNAGTGADGAWVIRNGQASDWLAEPAHDDLDPIGAGRFASPADQILWYNNNTGALVTY